MSLSQSIAVGVLILGLTITQVKWPPWTTTVFWITSLTVVGTNIVDLKEAERAFGGSALITLATLMVASSVLVASPIYLTICQKAQSLSLLSLTGLSLLLSSVLNNIPVYLAVSPILFSKKLPPWTFVHLSHACALGGLLTPLGTSSHFIANDLLEDLGKDRLTLIDFVTYTPLGVFLGFVGSYFLCSKLITQQWPSQALPPESQDLELGLPKEEFIPKDQPTPRSNWILPLISLWIVFSFLQDIINLSQWFISGCLLAFILIFGLVDRETPWAHFRGQTLAFTALPIIIGVGVRESGLGGYILDGVEAIGYPWFTTSLAVLLLTQVMHNSIIISVFVPSLLDSSTSSLVAATALGSLSLCLATGYPLNELVLEKTQLPPRALLLPGLGVALITFLGFFALHLLP